ncbi:unnamed protein product [Didymodactylos carnosus]|uniref:Uncharacterized protein n=1 Tax=Didymodactylos carnosus TaxID=1234261 RepID=A0A814TNE3_9BILA|nr:unnamed protein product [Didymodactylos carnosus]CAF1160463.1 unnamed protein product [Didymodactylos carnosus]CAF3895094.1 unnamed protein product [Didymodactylos carnosus]CAF3923947.1 unnamed protein product [Didymodactylos carnosus]
MADFETEEENKGDTNNVDTSSRSDHQETIEVFSDEQKLQIDLAKQLKNELKISVADETEGKPSPFKVAVVGMNELGSATAFLLLCKQVVTDIVIIDQNAKRLEAEFADLSTCTTFVSGVNVQASNQLASCEQARVVIICDVMTSRDERKTTSQYSSDGNRQSKNQNQSVDDNISQFKTTSRAISLYVRCAKSAPRSKGLLIGEKLGVSPASVTGIILGGHEFDRVLHSVTIAGIHLLSENPDIGTSQDKENWRNLHYEVNQREKEIIKTKGTEVWSLAMSCSELVECVLRNKREIHTVTVNVNGHYNVKQDLFLSLPAIVGQNGVSHLITTKMNPILRDEFSNLINNIKEMIKQKMSNEYVVNNKQD